MRRSDALPPPGQRLRLAGGAELNLLTQGSGEPIVLVHGLPGSACDWDVLAPRLARALRVVRYDRVGFGFSSRRQDSANFSLEQNARELLELLDALALECATLVGWSSGGGIAQLVAARQPERVARLVLVAPDAPGLEYPPDDPVWKLLLSPVGLPLARLLLSIPPLGRLMLTRELALAYAGRERVQPEVVAQAHALLALPGAVRSFIEETRQYDLAVLEPEAIAAPTLIIHGESDRLIPLAIVEQLHRRIRGSQLLCIENGSHMLPSTHAERLSDEILAFVRRG